MFEFPGFIAILHHFVAEGYGTRRTLAGAFLTRGAESLQAKIDRFVRLQGHVRRDHGCLETEAQKWIEGNTGTTHLSNPGEDE